MLVTASAFHPPVLIDHPLILLRASAFSVPPSSPGGGRSCSPLSAAALHCGPDPRVLVRRRHTHSAAGMRGGAPGAGPRVRDHAMAAGTGSPGERGAPLPTRAAGPAGGCSWAAGAGSRSRAAPPWASCRTRCAGARSPALCCASTRRSGRGGPEGGGARGPGAPAHRRPWGAQGPGLRSPAWRPCTGTPGPVPSHTSPRPPVPRLRPRAGVPGLANSAVAPPSPLPQRAELRGGHRVVSGSGFPAADPAHLHVGERHGLHHGGGAVCGRGPCPELRPGLRCPP